jgi:hypothetical protein
MPTPVFLAAGHNGLRLISRDGRTWGTVQKGRDGETFRAAAVGNGRLVAIGTYGGQQVLAHSADGLGWKQQTRDGGWGGYVRGLAFVNGHFLALGGDPGAVGAAEPYVLLSRDGEKWDRHNISGKFMVRRAAFGNGLYVGVGDRGRRARSADARTWVDVPGTKATETLIDVAFGNGVFVGVGLHGLRLTTADGVRWTDRQLGEEGEHLNAVIFAAGQFVAVGAGATWTSPDGRRWRRHANADAPLTATFGNGVFVGPRWRGRLMWSRDGVRWQEAHRAGQHVEAVAFGELR